MHLARLLPLLLSLVAACATRTSQQSGTADNARIDRVTSGLRRGAVVKGTPVLIHGTYPFGSPASWLTLETLAVPVVLPIQGVAAAGGSLRSDSGR